MKRISISDLQGLGGVAAQTFRTSSQTEDPVINPYNPLYLPEVYVTASRYGGLYDDIYGYYADTEYDNNPGVFGYDTYTISYYTWEYYDVIIWYTQNGGGYYTEGSDRVDDDDVINPIPEGEGEYVPTNPFFEFADSAAKEAFQKDVNNFYNTIMGRVYQDIMGEKKITIVYDADRNGYYDGDSTFYLGKAADLTTFNEELFHVQDEQTCNGNKEVAAKLWEYLISQDTVNPAYAIQTRDLLNALEKANWDMSAVDKNIWEYLVIALRAAGYSYYIFKQETFDPSTIRVMSSRYDNMAVEMKKARVEQRRRKREHRKTITKPNN